MHDAADHPAIIDPRLPACVPRKIRLKPYELSVVQPETVSLHQQPPFGNLESRNRRIGNPFYGSGAQADPKISLRDLRRLPEFWE